ncbi:MAG TPA: hypothetical protein VEQ58_06820 [Polyangiaceae bacterium]|nr:hypothetical protein [Polyangiaceae bacterium]
MPVATKLPMPPLPVASPSPGPSAARAMPPLPQAANEPPAKNPFMPSVLPAETRADASGFALPTTVAKPVAVAPQLAPAPRPIDYAAVRISDDIPDMFDGRARNRRAMLVVFSVAALALLGTIAAAIASHFRPL